MDKNGNGRLVTRRSEQDLLCKEKRFIFYCTCFCRASVKAVKGPKHSSLIMRADRKHLFMLLWVDLSNDEMLPIFLPVFYFLVFAKWEVELQ